MSETDHVSIVIPVYREEAGIGPVLHDLADALWRAGLAAEVLVVDDSPDDETGWSVMRVVPACSSRGVHVRHIHRTDPTRPGLAGAVIDGMELAHGEVTAVMDGDGQHPPTTVVRLLQTARGGVDLAIGARYVDGGSAAGLSGPVRHWVSTGATLITTTFLGARVRRTRDPMSGCFALRTAQVDLAQLHPQGYKVLLEILATHDLHVVDVPMRMRPRAAGESKLSGAVLVDGLRQTARLASRRLTAERERRRSRQRSDRRAVATPVPGPTSSTADS